MAKNQICKKSYLDADGNKSRSASDNAIAILFEFSNGETRTVEPADFPSNILKCATLNGLSQKLGDKYAGKTVSEAVELVDTLVEFLTDGQWIKSVEGAGSRPTLLAEAITSVIPDKYPDVAAAKKMLDALKAAEGDTQEQKDAKEAKRKGIEKVPEISAAIERIKANRAAEKAAKAAKAAADSDGLELSEI